MLTNSLNKFTFIMTCKYRSINFATIEVNKLNIWFCLFSMYLKISFAHGFVILTRTFCLFTFFKVLCHLKVLILRSKAKTGLEEIEERLGTWSVRLKKSNSWWESRISTSDWHSACTEHYWHIIIWGETKILLTISLFPGDFK